MSTKTRLLITLLIFVLTCWVTVILIFFTKDEVVEVTKVKTEAFNEVKPEVSNQIENEVIDVKYAPINGTEEQVEEELVPEEQVAQNKPKSMTEITSNGINATNPPKDVEVKQTINVNQEKKLVSTYMGYDTIGRIEIPAISLDYPILKYQSVSGMEIAPCLVYQKGEFNKSGFFYIAGHNYRNGKLFSNNSKLKVGDKITITSLDYNKRTYQVHEIFTTTPSDVSFLKQDDDGKTKLILQSCTDNEQERLIIIAK